MKKQNKCLSKTFKYPITIFISIPNSFYHFQTKLLFYLISLIVVIEEEEGNESEEETASGKFQYLNLSGNEKSEISFEAELRDDISDS